MKPDDRLDENLARAFRSLDQPNPSAGFTARTMKAVRRAPLPSGRRPLNRPFSVVIGWAALIACAVAVVGAAIAQPGIGRGFASLLRLGVGLGIWVVGWISNGVALADVFGAAGLAIARAAATKEVMTGLMLLTVVGALSLSALHRLLIDEGKGPRWQERS